MGLKESWVSPKLVRELLLVSFHGFRGSKQRKTLQYCGCFQVLWGIWLEHNAHFNYLNYFLWWLTLIVSFVGYDSFPSISLALAMGPFSGLSIMFRRISCAPHPRNFTIFFTNGECAFWGRGISHKMFHTKSQSILIHYCIKNNRIHPYL